MRHLLKELRYNPLLWLLVFVPVVFAAAKLRPDAHTLLFVLSVLAIVPLAALLSRATESVAAKTGDAVGGLLNATLGNLTELVIALTALRAGEYMLVKASVAGAIVTNALFMLKELPEPPERARLRGGDWRGAIGVFLLVFLSTFPVVLPFVFMSQVLPAMRVSNLIAVAMLFTTGYAFGRVTGSRPWVVGISMVLLGAVLVALTIALGG